jgi:hypothetical protein
MDVVALHLRPSIERAHDATGTCLAHRSTPVRATVLGRLAAMLAVRR